jgi:hypothetical protein
MIPSDAWRCKVTHIVFYLFVAAKKVIIGGVYAMDKKALGRGVR